MVTLRMPRPDPMEPVTTYAKALVCDANHVTQTDPDLCVYQFAEPTTFSKAATFGVTLGVVLRGSKQIRIDGEVLDVDPEHLVVITRDSEYESAARPASDGPYLGLSLMFSPERVARALLALTDAGGTTAEEDETVPAFRMPLDDAIADCLRRLVRTLCDPIERKLLVPLITDELLFRLLRSDAAAAVRRAVGHAGDAPRILESMDYIRLNHARKLTVDGLARRIAMSPSHFAHRFRAVARISPMKYVRACRLDQARALLVASGGRANQIASTVGFESAAHFAREFKRRFGAPPSTFARRGSDATVVTPVRPG